MPKLLRSSASGFSHNILDVEKDQDNVQGHDQIRVETKIWENNEPDHENNIRT